MKHEHIECQHEEIALCKKCDKVFCKNQSCQKEWSVPVLSSTFTYTTPNVTDVTGKWTGGNTYTNHPYINNI